MWVCLVKGTMLIQPMKADLPSCMPLTNLNSAIPKNILIIIHAVGCVIHMYIRI